MGNLSSILATASFSALETDAQAAVHQLFQSYQEGKPLQLDSLALFKSRALLNHSMERLSERLEQINPHQFPFLLPEQQIALENELLFAFYIFSAQFYLDKMESRRQTLQERAAQIKKCAELLQQLQATSTPKTPEAQLATLTSASEKHLKYLGLTVLAPAVSEQIVEFTGAGKTQVIKEHMGTVNNRRLQWVWVNSFLGNLLPLLPPSLGHTDTTSQVIAAPSPITGYMSWVLYYFRFGLNLSLLLKHTLKGPWMSAEEKALPLSTWERFKTQWDMRKFTLLNDSIWATANMACFFWLVGNGMLGYYGNVLTSLLLLMDTCLSAWSFIEETKQHEQAMTQLNDSIAKLMEALNTLQQAINKNIDIEENKRKSFALQVELFRLLQALKKADLDWKYKKYSLINDLTYAAGLLAAFAVMCCFLFPPAAMAPAAAMVLGVVGAALCFTFTTVSTAVKGHLEIAKLQANREDSFSTLTALLHWYEITKDPKLKIQIFLDIKQIKSNSDYQARLIAFQKLNLLRNVLIDALLPAVIFLAFMFTPLGVGLGILGAGFVLAVASHLLLKKFKPQTEPLPKLEPAEFEDFEKQLAQTRTPAIQSKKITHSPSAGIPARLSFFFQDTAKGNGLSANIKAPISPPGAAYWKSCAISS